MHSIALAKEKKRRQWAATKNYCGLQELACTTPTYNQYVCSEQKRTQPDKWPWTVMQTRCAAKGYTNILAPSSGCCTCAVTVGSAVSISTAACMPQQWALALLRLCNRAHR